MKLEALLKDVFNIRASDLIDTNKLIAFEEWDSMAHMLFIQKLEEEYSIELSGDEIASMQTIGDIKKLLISKGKIE